MLTVPPVPAESMDTVPPEEYIFNVRPDTVVVEPIAKFPIPIVFAPPPPMDIVWAAVSVFPMLMDLIESDVPMSILPEPAFITVEDVLTVFPSVDVVAVPDFPVRDTSLSSMKPIVVSLLANLICPPVGAFNQVFFVPAEPTARRA